MAGTIVLEEVCRALPERLAIEGLVTPSAGTRQASRRLTGQLRPDVLSVWQQHLVRFGFSRKRFELVGKRSRNVPAFTGEAACESAVPPCPGRDGGRLLASPAAVARSLIAGDSLSGEDVVS